ncbi:GNAT family N-acetyltransferase [Nocardioides sp.]|uniref:GNAT family N-acetyltransferase n=1 Tax=Nocardioides sp. TaxID=35761 RepID=UPI002C3855FE|nr:GNAT family N-acetyltransferase [Nocardioides sp.]HXH80261.1 GNAT family N-acetyltransferase [Nocardioides sp.]
MEVVRRHDPAAVERILHGLPEWFGVESAIAAYVADASRLVSYLAVDDREVVGVVLLAEHFLRSREVHLIAVSAARRGTGVGGALLDEVEGDLRREGVEMLEVHTVGPSYDDVHYEQTRAFYAGRRFVAIHEFDKIDWDGPTLVLVKAL